MRPLFPPRSTAVNGGVEHVLFFLIVRGQSLEQARFLPVAVHILPANLVV
jgi:hypothetical protein